MKILKPLGFLLLILMVSILAACNMDKMAQDERIAAFFSDLDSGNIGSLYTHIHPDNSVRNQRKDPSTWTMFPGTESYSYSSYTEIDSKTVRVNVTSSGPYDGAQWTFTMKEDTKDLWYINRLTSNPAGPSATIIP